MRHVVLAAALLTLTVRGTSADQPDFKGKTDAELIQGTWRIDGLESGGKMEPKANFTDHTFAFKKDKATLREGKSTVEFSFTLDAARTPKTIDLTVRGHTLKGIYKLDGDDLTMCFSVGGARPTEFATKAGAETELFTLKRTVWERYSDRAFGFAIEMPGKPVEKVQPADTSASLDTTTFTVRSEMEHTTYVLSVTPLAARPDVKEAEAALDAAQKSLLAEAGTSGTAKVEFEGKKTTPGTIAARELSVIIEVPDAMDKNLLRARLYVAGDRVYMLTATGTEDAMKAALVGKFWSSFRLPQNEKKGPPEKKGRN